ncbi:LysM peptidoglycan-binding domain-containing protein [Desulfamplus magnetovallimortis]|nr:LysM domain-containing protein [Desulfamplus magnetovallimortis]
MMKKTEILFSVFLIAALLTICSAALFFGSTATVNASTTKPRAEIAPQLLETAYKRYSLYRYKDSEILCERYTVKKGDWIYKIFRTKGELSSADFPLFLNIFKEINPGIKNMDSINPGQKMLIPLKRVKADDFVESTPGIVDVPVIKLSNIPESFDQFIIPHDVRQGDKVSDLIHKSFLDKHGAISQEGIFAFKLLNPAVESLDIIFEGSTINLPKPSIVEQPWFVSLMNSNAQKENGAVPSLSTIPPDVSQPDLSLTGESSFASITSDRNDSEDKKSAGNPKENKDSLPEKSSEQSSETLPEPENISSQTNSNKDKQEQLSDSQQRQFSPSLKHLKRLANLNNGKLMSRGKYHFPGDDGKDTVLDLSLTPVIRLQDGTRILIVPDKRQFDSVSKSISHFWRKVKIMEFSEIEQALKSYNSLNIMYGNHDRKAENQQGKSESTKSNKKASDISKDLTVSQSSLPYIQRTYLPIQNIIPFYQKDAVKKLLEITNYNYIPETEIQLPVDSITINVTTGLVLRPGKPDTVIFFGNVYGATIDAFMEKNKAIVISLPPTGNLFQIAGTLFSGLGASLTRNPSFISPSTRKAVTISGLYINTTNRDVFVSDTPMILKEAFDYLTKKQIAIATVSK